MEKCFLDPLIHAYNKGFLYKFLGFIAFNKEWYKSKRQHSGNVFKNALDWL